MNKILLSLAISAALASCINEPNNSDNSNLPVELTTSISNTRTSIDNTTNEVVFSNNDEIGLFEVTNNGTEAIKCTYNSTTSFWTTANPMYWKDRTTAHTFYSFYPYVAASNHTTITMPALKAQTGDVNSLAACDFLYVLPITTATHNSGATPGHVALRFKHASALLAFNLKASPEVDGSTFTAFKLTQTDIATGSTFNLSSSAATFTAPAVNDIIVTPTNNNTLSQTIPALYWVVINDKTPTAVSFSIDFTKAGNNYSASGSLIVPNAESNFLASSKYTYTITVNVNSINIDKAEINSWTPINGGNVDAN